MNNNYNVKFINDILQKQIEDLNIILSNLSSEELEKITLINQELDDLSNYIF